MVNPFDRSFFRFLLGFLCILAMSFAVLYVVGVYSKSGTTQASVGQ